MKLEMEVSKKEKEFDQLQEEHGELEVRVSTGQDALVHLINWQNFNDFVISDICVKGVLHPWALFLKTLCIFSKNKATSDKVSYGSGQKCSKELKSHSFTSVETIVVKLQWKMCKNQYFPCFEP